jgi:acetoin utilization deacetylase AcuC-like enzyme
MHIEILFPRYGGNEYFEPIGTITFQQTIGEDKWYGMTFNISTDNVTKLKKFTKVAEFIGKNTNHDSQPDEVLKLIGADEHTLFEGDFVSKSKIGQRKYKVMVNDNEHYKNIIARSDEDAEKQLKRLEIANSSVVYSGIVVL